MFSRSGEGQRAQQQQRARAARGMVMWLSPQAEAVNKVILQTEFHLYQPRIALAGRYARVKVNTNQHFHGTRGVRLLCPLDCVIQRMPAKINIFKSTATC
jgi:hypothetical protein